MSINSSSSVMINARTWFKNQPTNVWVEFKNIPYSIFWSVWNNYIESNRCKLHPSQDKFKII